MVLYSSKWPRYSKFLFSETAWPMKAKFHTEHPYEEGMKVYINDSGHMAKMATMAINNKHLFKVFFSRTRRPVILKLGMKHQGIELYKNT